MRVWHSDLCYFIWFLIIWRVSAFPFLGLKVFRGRFCCVYFHCPLQGIHWAEIGYVTNGGILALMCGLCNCGEVEAEANVL